MPRQSNSSNDPSRFLEADNIKKEARGCLAEKLTHNGIQDKRFTHSRNNMHFFLLQSLNLRRPLISPWERQSVLKTNVPARPFARKVVLTSVSRRNIQPTNKFHTYVPQSIPSSSTARLDKVHYQAFKDGGILDL